MCEPVSLRGPQNGALRGSPHPCTEDGRREQTPLPDSDQGWPLQPGLSVQERAAPAPPGSDRPTSSHCRDHCPFPTPLPHRARPCSGVFCARLERRRSGNTDQSVAWLFDSSGNQTWWGGGGPPPGLSRVCVQDPAPSCPALAAGGRPPRGPLLPHAVTSAARGPLNSDPALKPPGEEEGLPLADVLTVSMRRASPAFPLMRCPVLAGFGLCV